MFTPHVGSTSHVGSASHTTPVPKGAQTKYEIENKKTGQKHIHSQDSVDRMYDAKYGSHNLLSDANMGLDPQGLWDAHGGSKTHPPHVGRHISPEQLPGSTPESIAQHEHEVKSREGVQRHGVWQDMDTSRKHGKAALAVADPDEMKIRADGDIKAGKGAPDKTKALLNVNPDSTAKLHDPSKPWKTKLTDPTVHKVTRQDGTVVKGPGTPMTAYPEESDITLKKLRAPTGGDYLVRSSDTGDLSKPDQIGYSIALDGTHDPSNQSLNVVRNGIIDSYPIQS